MHRLRPLRLYFLCTTLALSAFLLTAVFVWYPHPFLYADGGHLIVAGLLAVQFVVGPLLVLIVYKPGKKGLVFDLTVIPLLQAAVLVYGGYVLFQERPLYIVFNVDRFSVISAASIDVSELKDPTLERGLFDRPKLVFVDIPADPKLREKILFESMGGGRDIDRHPELYEPYGPNVETIVSRGVNMDVWLEKHPDLRKELREITADASLPLERLVFIPLLGKRHAMVMVLDRSTGQPVGSLDIDPWES